ncbi:MAG: serine/threonine protein kinase [Candidatus Wallbacteria bacterium]|nr:serine/threonine protein kinase [Candidatus Wallbacteria bacterium]
MGSSQIPEELLAKFAFVEWLGKGATSVVYLGKQSTLGRNVVVKLLRAIEGDLEARFLREARVLSSLDHPGIARLIDFGQAGGRHYMATLFEPGASLASVLQERRALPWRETARVGRDVAEALAAVHDAGVIHRDVKPGNILIGAQGGAKLIDFGFSRLAASSLTAPGEYIGTPAYSAPEQCFSGTCDPLSDLYSLGVVLYEAMSGVNPFRGGSPAEACKLQLTHVVTTFPDGAPEVPDDLRTLVLSMLEKTPQDRPASVRQVSDRLAAILRGVRSRPVRPLAAPAADGGTVRIPTRPLAPADAVTPSAGPTRRRWPLLLAAATAAAGVFLLCKMNGPEAPAGLSAGSKQPVRAEATGLAFELTRSGKVCAVSLRLGREAEARLEEEGGPEAAWSGSHTTHRLFRIVSGPKDRFSIATRLPGGGRFQLGPFEGHLCAALRSVPPGPEAMSRLAPYLAGPLPSTLRLEAKDRAVLLSLRTGRAGGAADPVVGEIGLRVPDDPLARGLALEAKLVPPLSGASAEVRVTASGGNAGLVQTLALGTDAVELDPAFLACAVLHVTVRAAGNHRLESARLLARQ